MEYTTDENGDELMVGQLKKEYIKEYYTFEEWAELPESFRAELHDGVLVAMGEPTRKHQEIFGEIFNQLYNFLKGKPCKVYATPFGVRLNEKEDTVFEPDITVVCDKSKLEHRGICHGAPDMVVEILSPSTSRIDKVYKFNKYLEAGVREYWIVDQEFDFVQVHILRDGSYITRMYSKESRVPVSVLEGCVINLEDVFAE